MKLFLFPIVAVAAVITSATGLKARSPQDVASMASPISNMDCSKEWPLEEVDSLLAALGDDDLHFIDIEGCGSFPISKGNLLHIKQLYGSS
jgi:hypothetical protein